MSERFDVVCEQKRLRAHTSGGERGFRACVAAADDDDVVGFGIEDGGHDYVAGKKSSDYTRFCRRMRLPENGLLKVLLLLSGFQLFVEAEALAL